MTSRSPAPFASFAFASFAHDLLLLPDPINSSNSFASFDPNPFAPPLRPFAPPLHLLHS